MPIRRSGLGERRARWRSEPLLEWKSSPSACDTIVPLYPLPSEGMAPDSLTRMSERPARDALVERRDTGREAA